MNSSAERNVRIQILVPPRSAERLDRLMAETESASLAEVVRNALRLYEAVIDGAKQGRPFLQEVDGVARPVLMMGPYAAATEESHDEVTAAPVGGDQFRFVEALAHVVGDGTEATEAAICMRMGATRGEIAPLIEAAVARGAVVRRRVGGQPGIAPTHAGRREWVR